MKTLYQYLMESIFEQPLMESTFGPSDWPKHSYALDVITDLLDGKPVLLGIRGSDGSITKDDFDTNVLRDIQAKLQKGKNDKSDIDIFNGAYTGDLKFGPKMWSHIYKGIYSGKAFKISTKDQESVTSIIFNNICEEIKKDSKFRPDTDWIQDICESINLHLGTKINKSWGISIGNVCMVIIDHMRDELGANVENFRMERLNGHQSGQDVAIEMSKFIAKYCKQIGVKKDVIDPSDTFVYDVTAKTRVLDIIAKASDMIDTDFNSVREYIIKNFYTSKTPIFGGISLKKISSHPHLELCNIDNESMNVRVEKLDEPFISAGGNTCTVRMQGRFGEHCTRARLEFRTQGGTTLRASVTLEDDNGKRYPAQCGDCPIHKFVQIVKDKMGPDVEFDNREEHMEQNFKVFTEFISTNPLDEMTKIVRMATKTYEYNLPYIIIH